eukprot:CAMPEP_0205937546 /NCGR_PEP_ID=MMETSP1325-20131115/44431_1 /ASSEMBLY_ACC=CAM_ASM_000708 /TAXON_ID=236786 /ORGANISM="Florenciella sp., Strain RCC1007" /LENGTH=57 /DNA_ID=CAMNT_0053307825 /DNA_START=55 /DNA_END=225 /DNA_ORIENTATION=-
MRGSKASARSQAAETTSMTGDDSDLYRIPFAEASATDRRIRGTGLCIQGNHGSSTHK